MIAAALLAEQQPADQPALLARTADAEPSRATTGALRLDVWSWMLLIAGVPTTLLGLYYAAVGVRE